MSIIVAPWFIRRYTPKGWYAAKIAPSLCPRQAAERRKNPCMVCTRAQELRDPKEQDKVLDILWFLHSEFALEFYQQFLIRKGVSGFIVGVPDSGKTQLGLWFIKWLKELEKIIVWDTGKDDILPLFLMGKPIQILIPWGCHMEIRGRLPCPVTITPVPAPELFFDIVEDRNSITIISVRNFFLDDEVNLKRYVYNMFKDFSRRLRLNEFSWTPGTINLDEAYAVMGSDRFEKDDISQKTGKKLGSGVKENRKKGVRWLLYSQGFKDLPPMSRENTPLYGVKRGAFCEKGQNPTINYLSGFARECEPRHGWIILPNGKYFGKRGPLSLPFFPDPHGLRIIYKGFVDAPKTDTWEEEVRNDGGWRAASAYQRDLEVHDEKSEMTDEQIPVHFDVPDGIES